MARIRQGLPMIKGCKWMQTIFGLNRPRKKETASALSAVSRYEIRRMLANDLCSDFSRMSESLTDEVLAFVTKGVCGCEPGKSRKR